MGSDLTIQENEEIVRRFVDQFMNEGDFSTAEEFLAEDFTDYTPMGETTGRDAAVESMKQFRAAFPDFNMTIEDLVGDGDTFAARLTQRGTHEGVFMGIEPTGKSFEIEAMAFGRLEEGKLVERRARPDVLGLLRQLGISELPAA